MFKLALLRIAIYGRNFNDTVLPYVQEIFDLLEQFKIQPIIYSKFKNFLQGTIRLPSTVTVFHNNNELKGKADVLLTLGGAMVHY